MPTLRSDFPNSMKIFKAKIFFPPSTGVEFVEV
jgi:hypothetical protein